MFKNQSVIVEMPPSETAETKNLSTKNENSFWGERSLSGTENSRFCGSASLKIERFQLFFGEGSRVGLQHRRLDCFSSPSPPRSWHAGARRKTFPPRHHLGGDLSSEIPILLNPEEFEVINPEGSILFKTSR
jgi:hypothetical protein